MKKIILFFLIFIVLVNNASAYTFTNIGGDFKIEYPTGWTYIEEPDGSDQTFTSQTGRASVRVTVTPSDGKGLDEIVSDRIKYLQDSYGITPFSEKSVTIGNLKGKELMFNYYYEQKNYKYQQILIVSGNIYFIISGAALTTDFPFFSEDLEKIINSFALLKPATTPKVTAGYTAAPTPTPVKTEPGAPTISLHSERTGILVGEEVLLKLSILAPLGKPKMEFQIILLPPSGMSVTSQEFSQTGGQYSQKGTIETGDSRFVDIKLRANEAGDKDVEATVRYYFANDTSNIKEVLKSQKIKVIAAEAASTTTKNGEPSDGGSAIIGIIAIIAIIFTGYIIITKVVKTVKSKVTKGIAPTEAEAHEPEQEAEISASQVIEEPARIEPKIKKESAFEAEKRKQHNILPPEELDIDTRNYLSSGINTAISTLDAEIANAENDALELQGAIKKNEDVLAKLGTRLVNNEISEQTYNDLKNKYLRKISELKGKFTALESEASKLKKIRSFINEKGKYYT
ncbi:MAG: hypothetical protein PHU34_00395 [Candidatus Methanoperedens sp.]|nr:hypothetical protein [Candidatus Methanoperedens sp.]